MCPFPTTLLSVALAALLSSVAEPLNNGLALTPPMGWLAWERFVCETDCSSSQSECIDFRLFQDQAQRMVEDGFKQVGYEYVNIDDCWSERRRENGSQRRLLPDAQRFPPSAQGLADGIEQLAKRVHSLGLKLGIYGDCGTSTCQRFPGQLSFQDRLQDNYFKIDSQTFADWQIDSFKFDGCFLNISRAAQICPLMGDSLNATGRPMLFSCSWPAYENDESLPTNWSLVVEKCNLWRAFGDIEDSWKSVIETIDYFVLKQDLVLQYHGPGHWFDADQLVIGNFGLSFEQERAQMAIWSIWASPLYMSNDLRKLSKESSKILRNKWVIAVNQDRMGLFGLMVRQAGQLQVFAKPVEPIDQFGCPSYAIVYFDRQTLGNSRLVSFKLSSILNKLHQKLASLKPKWSHCSNRTTASFTIHDLFNNFSIIGKPLTLSTDSLELRVNPSGVRMVKLLLLQEPQ